MSAAQVAALFIACFVEQSCWVFFLQDEVRCTGSGRSSGSCSLDVDVLGVGETVRFPVYFSTFGQFDCMFFFHHTHTECS